MSNTTKKKILYVITQTEWGGAQKYIYDLITSSEAVNYDITVAVGKNKDKTLIDKLKSKGIEVVELKHLVRPISPLNDLRAVWELRQLYRQIRPDIIHLNSTKAGVIGSLANHVIKKISYNVIYTAHGWVFNEPMNKSKKFLYWFMEKITSRPKDRIICVSEFDRQTALKYKIAKTKKLTVIHNGLNIDSRDFFDQDSARKQLNLPTDKIIVGTIANFYKTKGLEYFIKAVKELNNDNIVGAVIGEGDLRSELENLINQLNLKNKFILLGKIENASKYLKAYDIYISSSVKEGLPYSILEAMSAQLPIIATKVGGIPELINEQNGILVQSGDYQSMAENIKYLIDNKDVALKFGRGAREDAEEKFSEQKMIKETFNLYQ